MSKFLPEPPPAHGEPRPVAVVLINLGTPQAPTAPALRSYLAEFLADPRVVEIPGWAWRPILHGLILPFRPARSAAKYAAIWTERGSPLRVHLADQAAALRAECTRRGWPVLVLEAMRYGEPSIAAALAEVRRRRVARVLFLPLYPQYSAATTASSMDEVNRILAQTRNLPELRWVRSFHDDPGYVAALRASVERHWQQHGRGECLVMSFHGMPRRSLDAGDPYFCECQKTARLLAEALGLQPSAYRVCFQSRFGRAAWLEPYTAPTVRALAAGGVRRIDLICPGFSADCLETLEEIALEVRQEFLAGGGQVFSYIPCLNESGDFIASLADLVFRHTAGWPVGTEAAAASGSAAAAQTQARAKTLGAAG